MTTMAPAGEGGGGNGTTTTTTGGSGAEQAPNTTAPPAQQQQQQHPPPSPLSGCYLLVVLPEPHTAQHKDLILNRLAKGFLSWDKDSCHVDLDKELQALVAQAPEGEEARNGERLIQYATENLVTEVLIYPQSNTLLQCIRNLLASFTKHRHIIHAGYTFGGNGSWILQDGTFSLADFLDAFSEHEVQRVLRAYENSVTVDIHCAGVGDWTTSRLSKEICTRACRVRVNPDDVLTAGMPAITSFTNYIGQYLIAQTLDQLMEPSEVVGNIRFSHPTLYVFPGGQGDAALFGISGFNMLVDGGFARKACFWDFARHLDRLDAVLVTRINNSNVGGMSSVLRKKKDMHVYPQIGHFFCNLVERRHSNSPDGDKDLDPLILDLIDIGQEMVVNLRHINLRPHPCYRNPEPINLYHKVGHGTLDMYVLSPSKDSREVREFLSKWNASDPKLFAGSHKKDSNSILFPVQNLVSICALLVWQPANPEDTITRILFPGSTPQHKIFEGFERLKHLEFLKHPTCTAKSLSPSTSFATLKDKAAILKPKLGSVERETKLLAEIRREKKDVSEIKAVKKDSVADDTTAKIPTGKPAAPLQPKTESKAKKVFENKKIESETKESKIVEKELKETKKEVKRIEKSERAESETKKTDAMKVETEKTAPAKEPKLQKIEIKKRDPKDTTKPIVKSTKPEITTKPSIKPVEKKSKPSGEKKDIVKSSPTTPKKLVNGTATKTEISRTVGKSTIKITSKISSATPAKSAKDANNRMVVEQKNIELSSMAGSASSIGGVKAPIKSKTKERKPISRRTKPISLSKARLPISPAKSTRSTPTASVKSEKDAVIRKVKGGTTDSSAVSTPSGIETESAIKLIDKNLTEKSEDISLDSIESKVLADLKEEREVVEEIEAVLQKAERIEESRKDERFQGDDEITAEATDKKEEDMTEEDVTAEMDDMPKKISRKESQELTEEDEYLIVEKEEIYTEDSVQSGDAEQKHHLDEADSEKTRTKIEKEPQAVESEQEEEKEFAEEKKDEVPEKKLVDASQEKQTRRSVELSPEHKELLKEEMKQIIASAEEAVQKTEEKDDSGKKDSEDITKEPSSLSPDKLDSSVKPDIDQKEVVPEKLEESQERISTLESGATTTAPTLPEDERIPLDEIKEDVDEKHVIEEVKENGIPIKEKEVISETLPVVSKPEVKVLDVRLPTYHGIVRDVVKTPDEVADLPVHEEVDPKLYRMDDLEKDKDTKIPAAFQDQKEPPAISPSAPPVKEQKDKGMFSFFGKVADKFEKGIDKLTKKARRDSDKDAEDKSSKSSSPKESKIPEKAAFEAVDIDKVFPKMGKTEEKLEAFEHSIPQVSDIKVAAIKETATFLQEEKKETKIESPIVKSEDKKVEEKLKDEVIEDIEEVEAFVEEASRKFKNVKDSLQDSLESLEDNIVDAANKLTDASKDTVKDTLTGAAEKLVDIKSDVADLIDSKEPEKVKFIIPSHEDLEGEDDDSDIVIRDFKEAVRDVAEVLVGTAGIQIEKEEKLKDVVEIVKKVAEVLKEDDFLTEKALYSEEDKKKVEDKISKSPSEGAVIPKKVGVTEELAPQEQVEELLAGEAAKTLASHYEKTDGFEIHEELCAKVVKDKDVAASSPVRDAESDKEAVKRICEDIMKNDIIEKPIIEIETDSKVDVMELGLEEVCVKHVAKREIQDEKVKEEDKEIIEPEISFEQKLSPGKAELVTVTPGSTPTSPKLATELKLPELPAEYRDIFNKDTSIENIIEEFIMVKKHKITPQVLEYVTIVKSVPKIKIINIIQEIIIKYKIPREKVADNVQILRTCDDISLEKRMEIENYIINEYINKNNKISLISVDDISTKKLISKHIVIEIVEEIIIKRQASRESVFDISDESYFMILKYTLEEEKETELVKQESLVDISDTAKVEFSQEPIKDMSEKIIDSSSIQGTDDQLLEGFVNIPSTDAVEAFLQHEREKSHEYSKIGDGFEAVFEAVEQEYKVQGIPSVSSAEKPAEPKDKETEEISELSDVIEADEKFVKETIEKGIKEEHIAESKLKEEDLKKVEPHQVQDIEVSEVSEIDTKEKYLDEAKEKLDMKESVSEFERKISLEKSEILKEVQEKISLEKSHADATGRTDLVDIDNIASAAKPQEKEAASKDVEVHETAQESDDGVVKRMVVTASSEDGGHETEICPSGTITFMKTPTPEDSLKDMDLKLTPEKDSLALDKDSLQTVGSTPGKDSIILDRSDQIDEKVIPKDSLEKSTSAIEVDSKPDHKEKSEGVADQITAAISTDQNIKPSVLSTTEMARTPDSLYSGDASPAESVFSKSPTETAFPHPKESLMLEEIIFSETINLIDKAKEDSKLPTTEKEIEKKTTEHEKSTSPEENLKSTSSEKDDSKKEVSPEKTHITDDLKETVDTKATDAVEQRSKSPSMEKEEIKKEASPEKTSISDIAAHVAGEPEPKEGIERSKSASVAKESSIKEGTPDKTVVEDMKFTATKTDTTEKERSSKSPSLEKEISKKEEVFFEVTQLSDTEKERSMSPSVEKETMKKEDSSELSDIDQIKDKSKPPSVEKEVSRKESISEVINHKAKSPSVEKEISHKAPSPEKSIVSDDKVRDEEHKSKSPSVEKEISKKDPSIEIESRSKFPSMEKEEVKKETDAKESLSEEEKRSKSPSVEKEHNKKEETLVQTSVFEDEKKVVSDKIITEDQQISKSPSVEMETSKKERSPEKSIISVDTEIFTSDAVISEAERKSKSPSLEKETSLTAADVQEATAETVSSEQERKSKSPSVEKEIKKEASAEKILTSDEGKHDEVDQVFTKARGNSKSPSVEKEIGTKSVDTKEPLVEKHDRSKAPSVEKETEEKESSKEQKLVSSGTEESMAGTVTEVTQQKSNSPSVEREEQKIEKALEEKSELDRRTSIIDALSQAERKSRSPSAEMESCKKEDLPEKQLVTKDIKPLADEKIVSEEKEKSKSPSVEKELSEKEVSPEKDVKHNTEQRSKSPNVEKEAIEKHKSSEIVSALDSIKEILSEKDQISKSPSVEKEASKKESSPDKTSILDDAKDAVVDIAISEIRSKSGSPEKEPSIKETSPEKTHVSDDTKDNVFDAVTTETEHKSKSPSVEKELIRKETSSEKELAQDDAKVSDADERSTTPSIEKEVIKKDEASEKISDVAKDHTSNIITAADQRSKSEANQAKPTEVDKIIGETEPRSKSPSIEKEEFKKEGTPEKEDGIKDHTSVIDTTAIKQRSKSPSVEREQSKEEASLEKSVVSEELAGVRSKSPSVEKENIKKDTSLAKASEANQAKPTEVDKIIGETEPRSKSPSIEKEEFKKEGTPEKEDGIKDHTSVVDTTVTKQKSKSPNVENEISKKEPSPEKTIVLTDEVEQKSKSPNVEKEISKEEPSSEKTIASTDEVAQKTKSPSVEKEIRSKETSPEKTIVSTGEADQKSKSPSVEKEISKKEASPEKTIVLTDEAEQESRSPSIEKEISKEELSPEKTIASTDEVEQKSKSPSVEKEISKEEPSPEQTIASTDEVEQKSKSPSVEKEISKKEASPEKTIVLTDEAQQESRSLSVEKEISKEEPSPEKTIASTDEVEQKSKSPSVEKEISKIEPSPEKEPITMNEVEQKSKSPSVEKEISKKETSPEKTIVLNDEAEQKSKSPSVEKEISKEEPSPEKTIASTDEVERKSKSPSVEKEISTKETSPEKTIVLTGEAEQKSKSPSVEKEISKIEPSPEKEPITMNEVEQKSKSPSVEKEISKEKPSPEKTIASTDEVEQKSKSPSVEKEISKEEPSPEKTIASTDEVERKSKSPSVEKEISTKETSPEKTIVLTGEAEQKSKSPSVEKEISKIEPSPEKEPITMNEVEQKSKSPSVEKEISKKETSPEKTIVLNDEAEQKSKSPSVEKEISKNEASPEKTIVLTDEAEQDSKSPSVEKEISKEEPSPEKTIASTDVVEQKSKSPSVEKEISKNEASPEKTIVLTDEAEQDSKSPSVDKEISKEEPSPEKTIASTDEVEQKSKSPSVEKEISTKETSPEKTIVSRDEVEQKSKSSSVEKEISKKEASPEKTIVLTDETEQESKSPSVEKEISKEEPSPEQTIASTDEVEQKSKSPSVQKDISKKELSPEKTIVSRDEVEQKSKSPSVEKEIIKKEASPEKTIVLTDETEQESKSPSVEKEISKKEPSPEKETVATNEVEQKSKSPSVENEISKIELSPEKTIVLTDEAEHEFKSPSVEKEISKKEPSPGKETVATHEVEQKSKSPSVDKEISKKEVSPEKTIVLTDEAEHEFKSTSVEKEITKKETSPEKETVTTNEVEQKCKSPSVEKEINKKEELPDKTTVSADDSQQKSKSPSIEKESIKNEASLEKESLIVDLKESVTEEDTRETEQKSKSPSTEKEETVKEASPEKDSISDSAKHAASEIVSSDAKEKSKSPSVEKEICEKEPSIDVESRSKSPSMEKGETKKEITTKDSLSEEEKRSKSPSVEKEEIKKDSSLHDITTDQRSKSPSIEKEEIKKEASPENALTSDETKQDESEQVCSLAKERSPSSEKETTAEKSATSASAESKEEKVTGPDATRQSPSLEKEKSPEKSTGSNTVDARITEKDVSSKEVSPEPSIGFKEETSPSDMDATSRSANIPDSTNIKDIPFSKSPSPEKIDSISVQFSDSHVRKPRSSVVSDKFDEDSIDRTKSPSILSDKSDDKDEGRSKSPSIVGDKFDIGLIDDHTKDEHHFDKSGTLEDNQQADDKGDKSRSPSLPRDQMTDKSKSVSSISEKARADETVDVRKASITSTESHTDDKGKDRSRSHSLFDTGDRTPLVRSRAASLYDDKIPEKLGIHEHAKNTSGHADDIFEEKDELRLSQETLGDLHKDILKRDSIDQVLNSETKKAIEDFILNEYVNKKKIITLRTVNEISVNYKIEQNTVIKIINEIINNLKMRRETVIDFDEVDYEETMQKVLEDEENLIHYINDEFIAKKKKINSKLVDEIACAKSVSRHLVILVIENIITSRSLRRESVVDADLSESQNSSKKENVNLTDVKSTVDKQSTSDTAETLKNESPSPELGTLPSSKFDRSEPHIDEEITTISENKRIEVESLLLDNYISQGIKITENILEQIITKTSLPKYIIIEIIEEILMKKYLSRDAIAEKSIFHDDDYDDAHTKLDYEGKATSEMIERKSSGFSTPETRHYEDSLEQSIPYTDYESPFHKAFMGGMTQIRTTHITTLSGKSTSDFGPRDGTPDSTSEITSTMTTTITSAPEKLVEISDDQSERHSQQISGKTKSDTDEQTQQLIKTLDDSHSQSHTGDTVVVLKTTQIVTHPDKEKETPKDFTKSESISGETVSEKKIQQKLIHGDDTKQESTEIITIKTVKTIISEKDVDPQSLIGTLDNASKVSTITEKTFTTTEEKVSTSQAAKVSQTSTAPSSTTAVEEKLISLATDGGLTLKTSDSSSTIQNVKTLLDSGKSTPDLKQEEQIHSAFTSKDLMDHTISEQLEQSALPLIRDLISDERSYSGKSSPDVSLPKDIAYSTGKSTPDVSMSPLIRDECIMQSHFSGRSTPDRRSDNRSRTATPEGFRSGEVIRTTITTTRTMSDDGEIITTTKEVTEATNDKGETVVLAEKTDVKVDEKLHESLISESKPIDIHRSTSPILETADKEVDPTSPRSDLSSGHSRAATHIWESSEERHTYSDEEQTISPYSPSPYHPDPRLSTKDESVKSSSDFASAAMSSSFYGELPDESVHFSSLITKTAGSLSEQEDFSFKKFTVEKEYAGRYADKGSKKYIDEADLDFEKALTGFKDEKDSHEVSQDSSVLGASSFSQELSKSGQSKISDADSKRDPLAGWESPLGLPSPKAPRKFNLRSPIQPCSSADLSPDSLNFDVINDWGEPMRLPSPAPATNEVSNKGSPGTPKKEKNQTKKVLSENIKNKKRSESPSKNDKKIKDSKNKVQPVYVDLTYVSHYGNSFYTALEFFKKVRARYYVFSGTEPSREVYDALLEAKKTWEDKDLEVTMIPTYDTDTLGYWVADNEEALAAHHIDLSPSASRCTINLQDHETSCSAYRLEF